MQKFKLVAIFNAFFVLVFVASTCFGASITGTITYEGAVPKLKEIKMDADPICITHNANPVYPQSIVLGEGNTMGNIFVRITSGIPKKNYPAPTEPVEITQKGCMYDPHVIGVMVGQPVKILNPDGTLHNVHAMPKVNAEFNLAMPKFRKETSKTFNKAEFMFPMKCDVHPWMGAWISVMAHPYFAVTKDDGQYTIGDLPAGDYELEAWQEKLGSQKIQVSLVDGETKSINFSFSRPEKK